MSFVLIGVVVVVVRRVRVSTGTIKGGTVKIDLGTKCEGLFNYRNLRGSHLSITQHKRQIGIELKLSWDP